MEDNTEEVIDLRNQNRIKNLPWFVENKDAVCKSFVDSDLNDPSIIRNTTHYDFNDKNLDKVRLVRGNFLAAVRKHLTPNLYVDEVLSHRVNESSLLILESDQKLKLDDEYSKNPNFFNITADDNCITYQNIGWRLTWNH